MKLTRRQFITGVGGGALGAVLAAACGVPEDELLMQSKVGMPEDVVTGLDNWYATIGNSYSTGEGLVVRVMEGRAKKIEGNVDYPINRGKHSARSEALLQDLYNPDRIKAPMARVGQRGEDNWEEIGWSDAMSRVAHQLEQIKDARKNREVVMVTNPSVSHAALVAERFISAYRGTKIGYETLENTNLRHVVKDLFDQDRLPDIDIENSDYVLSFGADFLNTWISPVRYMRGYGEFRQGGHHRGKLVHIDSRFSMTGANADELIYVEPGREGLLALSIAQVIIDEGLGDSNAAKELTGDGQIDVGQWAPDKVAEIVGVEADTIKHVAREFASKDHPVAFGGGLAGAHTNGKSNLTAIYSLNYLVGSLNSSGGLIFNPAPPTSDLQEVEDNLKIGSMSDWRDLVRDMEDGKVQALLIDGVDPVYGLPEAIGFKEATYNVPLIFSFANTINETSAMADLILPCNTVLEDWGTSVPMAGPGYQVVGFQQPVVRPFFEDRGEELGTKSTSDALMGIAANLEIDLGLEGSTFKEVVESGAKQLFELGRGSVKAGDFRAFWTGILQRGGWWDTTSIVSSIKPSVKQLPEKISDPEFTGPDGVKTFNLIPFSSSSLGEGENAHLPWMQSMPDPVTSATWQTWIEINIKTAEELDITEGDVIRVLSAQGTDKSSTEGINVLAYPHPAIPPGVVSIPIGQGHTHGGRYSKGRGANVMSILGSKLDEQTGSLAWAATKVKLEKVDEWKRLPKFENSKPDLARDSEHRIIKITPIKEKH
tara:strand:+ start:153607 stop:155910 length:2304 start_codon:yes stop_codon:yes gene_type:complete